MSLVPSIFVPLPAGGVFLPCDHGLDFLHKLLCVCAVCVFTLLLPDRASLNIPFTTPSCQSGTTWSAGQEMIKGASKSSNESMTTKTTQNKNDKGKGATKQSTCQKKIEGHSIDRVWYTASRETSDTPLPPPHRNYLAFAPTVRP